ncbi:MAG: hypothetical protein AB7Q17_06870 [Phycisphaerae bacterium]
MSHAPPVDPHADLPAIDRSDPQAGGIVFYGAAGGLFATALIIALCALYFGVEREEVDAKIYQARWADTIKLESEQKAILYAPVRWSDGGQPGQGPRIERAIDLFVADANRTAVQRDRPARGAATPAAAHP